MQIKSAEFLISNSRAADCPQTGLPEYAFIGRSNVGKSSLVNMLTSRKALANTSSTPGKTMLINHFLINGQWYLVDLPGYGYAKRSKREQLTCLFVLVDSRLSPQKIDVSFIRFLGENGVPFAIIFTKADKNKPTQLARNVQEFLQVLAEEWEELPPHFVTSSTTTRGRDELLGYIQQINDQMKESKG